MKNWIAVVLLLLLASCGGGGSNGRFITPPPTIQGVVFGFPTGTAPADMPNVVVVITDSASGADITDATVTVNGVALTYNSLPTHSQYEGTVSVSPGSQVTLAVTAGGNTYTSSGTQPTSYPVLSAPKAGDTWGTDSINSVSWSGGVPLDNAYYLLGVMDAADPIGATAYVKATLSTENSYPIPAYSLTTGNKDVILGLTTSANVSNASSYSSFIVGGFDYVPITVNSGVTYVPPVVTLTSIAVTPGNPTLVNGTTAHLKAMGNYSDNSTQDLTSQVTWLSSDPSKATVDDTGLISAISNGSTTITASLGSISGVTTAIVFQPTSVSTDWATFQGNAAHTGYVDVQLDPSAFSQIWTWSAPANSGGLPVHINSVATSAGKVFVTKDIYYDQAALYALNEADGTTSWSYSLGNMASEGPPAVANGSVFVPTTTPSEQCVMWAIDATLGTYQYKMISTCQWSSFFAPTALDGSVVNAYVNSYSIVSGGLQWSAPVSGMLQATPAIDANYVYQYGASNGSPSLYVLDKFTGEKVSTISDPFSSSFSYSWLFSAPMLGANGNVISFSDAAFSGSGFSSSEQYQSRILVDYDIAGKTYSWRSSNAYLTHPAMANGVIFVARNSPATLDALSETDGHVLWSWTPPAGDSSFHRNSVVARNLVFVSTDKNVYAIDLATHQSVWQFAQPGMLAISGSNVLYIATGATISDGNLYAIKLK